MGEIRAISPSYVAGGPTGVCIRTRLTGITPADEKVLRLVGQHLAAPGFA
jgi:hypothetical protein